LKFYTKEIFHIRIWGEAGTNYTGRARKLDDMIDEGDIINVRVSGDYGASRRVLDIVSIEKN
jgi:hypothetical protein